MKTYITPAAHIIELDSNHLLADSLQVGGTKIENEGQILSNRRSQNGIWDDDL